MNEKMKKWEDQSKSEREEIEKMNDCRCKGQNK